MPGGRGRVPSLFVEAELLAAGDGIVESIEPNRPGNVAIMGESAFGSKETVELIIWGRPLMFKPEASSSGIGVGGVGVLGGAGIGRLEAMTDERFPNS